MEKCDLMRKSIEQFYQKYRQLLLYLLFGVCTTIINTIAYGVLYETLAINNVLSTIIAWLLAVLFAFITNKIFVFQSENTDATGTIKELVSFFSCRLLTGLLDVAIMVVAVDCMNGNSLFWKLISNVIVTIINYVASRLLIFKQ